MADLSLIPEAAWREAQRRAEVIRSLTERGYGPRYLVRVASWACRSGKRTLCRCREADGALTALLPGRSGGGRGRTCLLAVDDQQRASFGGKLAFPCVAVGVLGRHPVRSVADHGAAPMPPARSGDGVNIPPPA